jgi:hypothetical protein
LPNKKQTENKEKIKYKMMKARDMKDEDEKR